MANGDALLRFKESLLETGLFHKIPSDPAQYRCKPCPFCGDTRGKMYVRIDLTNDIPVLYHCFVCNESGVMNKTFLDYFDLGDTLRIPKQTYRKKLDVATVSTVVQQISCVETDDVQMVSEHIHDRIGVYPTLQQLQTFQYVGNPFQYVKDYLEPEIQSDYYLKRRSWFKLTNGNITGRSYQKDDTMRWMRYQTKNCVGRGLYTMKDRLDLYRPINVCITEGIMDAIGLFMHHHVSNAFHIAVLGKDYSVGLRHMLNMGVFGDSINIRIYKDADVDINRIRIHPDLRKLFKRIDVYQNTLANDYGVTEDKFDIVKMTKL